MKKIYIALICVVTLFLTGLTYKVNLFTLLNDGYELSLLTVLTEYQEECYEYGQYDLTDCSGYWSWDNYTKINESWYRFDLTEPICKCGYFYLPNGCLYTISLPNESNCLKYHLVRKTDGLLSDN